MSGLKTLVIDADIRSTMTSRLLGPLRAYGKPCQDPIRLNIVPAPGRPFDLLPSSAVDEKHLLVPGKMKALFAELAAVDLAANQLAAYDIVIVNLPTLASGADELIVGSVLDGVLIIAEWGKTHVETLRELVRTLQAGRTPVLGVLLTMSKRRKA
jgi:Mrp family chromosome partitioning ATPase